MMWNRLNEQQKNWGFGAAIVVTFIIAYHFSFKHTIAAYRLNHKLKKEQVDMQGEDSAFLQVNKKYHFYTEVVKSYQVKKEDRDNRLWQAVSGMAVNKNVKISYTPQTAELTDTAGLAKEISTQQFTFKGNYFNLVKLLDTLSKSTQTGHIGKLYIYQPKTGITETKNKDLTLQLDLKMLDK
ncbi:hypothetical protein [Pedobacter montanisoli]|uniref:Uncharacterized protein n=1 Tax=Pedobacter montanisoli TaxID=2923277 RepID=A0ABS9ZZC9_9SPHI|nr:hypothetical protein [Pedobacter montanisoli]MCJ0743676.1 hypothetical protein [Pedobacter montanisoli]